MNNNGMMDDPDVQIEMLFYQIRCCVDELEKLLKERGHSKSQTVQKLVEIWDETDI